MSMDQAITEAYARSHVHIREAHALELRHSSFTLGVHRFIDHDRDVLITLESGAPLSAGTEVLFAATAAEISKPDMSAEGSKSFKVLLSNIGGILMNDLHNVNQDTSERIGVTLRILALDTATDLPYTAGGSNGVTDIIHFTYAGDICTIDQVAMDLITHNPGNSSFPGLFYTPKTHPALFR